MSNRRSNTSFNVYYQSFLKRHSNGTNRFLHVLSALLFCLSLPAALLFHSFNVVLFVAIFAFGCCFLGHVIFEKNNPIIIKNFFKSVIAVFVFSYDVLTGKEKLF